MNGYHPFSKHYLDVDGFFVFNDILRQGTKTDDWKERCEYLSIDDEEQSREDLFEQFYFGFQSSINVVNNGTEKGFDKDKLERLFEILCLPEAEICVQQYEDGKLELPIGYLQGIRRYIVQKYMSNFPEIEEIKLRLTMKPRLTSRVSIDRTIYVPALARGVLNHFNLVLLNNAYSAIDTGIKTKTVNSLRMLSTLPPEVEDKQLLARLILPYLVFCHDNVSVANLPFITAYSAACYEHTKYYTNLQMLFICAHEYAHIILRHFDGSSEKSNIEIECEADKMAVEMVVGYIKKDSVFTARDVFTAIRWLFKFQMLEESCGELLQNKTLCFRNSIFSHRRRKFQEEMQSTYKVHDVMAFDQIGFLQIIQLQNVLDEYGCSLLNSMLRAFENSKNKKEIEPWWEIIKN